MPHSDSQSGDDRVNEAIAAYLEAVERGEKPDREKFLAQHADIAAELDSFLGNAAEFKQLAGGSDSLESRLQAELGGEAPAKAGTPTPGNPFDPDERTMNFPQRNVPSSRTPVWHSALMEGDWRHPAKMRLKCGMRPPARNC